MKILFLFSMLTLCLSACTLDKTDTDINYAKMGFPYDFNEPYEIEYVGLFLEDFWRTDGTLSPYKNDQITFINWSDEELIFVRSKIDGYVQYFDTNVYNIYSSNEIDQQQRYYTDVVKVKDTYQVIFYRDNHDTIPWNIRPGDYIDVIESNGIYSYVLNKKYLGHGKIDNKEHNFRVFYAIYHSIDFPYIVYFNKDYVFFINRNSLFSKECITQFDSDSDMILFKD